METITINRQWRLTEDQYFPVETQKTNICLHHTVGGSAKSTFDYWQSTPDRIATSYLIERDGTIYEVFDPLYWAHHLGLKMPRNVIYNKRTIGIELAGEGGLKSGQELNIQSGTTKFDPEYLYAFNGNKKLYHLFNDKNKFFDLPVKFRGYFYFDNYEDAQVDATCQLVKHLCAQFNIPKEIPVGPDQFRYDPQLLLTNWAGIFTHTNVRADKSDLCPSWDWTYFQGKINEQLQESSDSVF